MHVLHGDAGINDIHIFISQYISDCAAAALVNSAELRKLVADIVLVHDVADLGDELCRSIVGTGLASGTGILVEGDTLAEVSGILRIIDLCVVWIKSSRDIGRQHAGIFQSMSDFQIGVIRGNIDQFGNRIFEESGLCTGGTDRTDLFLIGKNADGSTFRIDRFQ